MGLNERYKLGFIDQIDASRRGDVIYIPTFLDRVNEVFNLMQSRYTLIFGATGTGKTAFMDYLYVLAPWTYLKQNEEDAHWEVLYFSLERKVMFKHAKWISWFLFRDKGLQVSADELMGWGTEPLSDAGYKLVRSYDDEISDLLERVRMFDGKVSINTLREVINSRARELGTLFYVEDDIIVQDEVSIGVFSDKCKEEQTKVGVKRYVEITHKGTTHKLYEHERRYFLHNPKTFVFIAIDGIGLFGSSDFSTKKSTLDTVSEILAEARDVYGFSPIVVSQQNRELGSTQRLKLHGSDLSPQIEDVQGSSQMAHDSDLVLGLFDPFQYKAYNTQGMYGNYNILQGMMHPKGFSRFRSLHILKNSFGFAGKRFGLKFVGESNDFSTLPLPEETEKIAKIYADISVGK